MVSKDNTGQFWEREWTQDIEKILNTCCRRKLNCATNAANFGLQSDRVEAVGVRVAIVHQGVFCCFPVRSSRLSLYQEAFLMFISPPWNTVESIDLWVISSTKTIKSEEIERLKTRFILLAIPSLSSPPSPPRHPFRMFWPELNQFIDFRSPIFNFLLTSICLLLFFQVTLK